MEIAISEGRQTLLKRDIRAAWSAAYLLRNEMHMIVEYKGSWVEAAKHGNPDKASTFS